MTAFVPPTPPIDLRRDIEALDLYHAKCTSKPIQTVTADLLEALENTEPIVDCQSAVYLTFRNQTWETWMQKMSKKHDADKNRWYFHRLRRTFRLVKYELYGTTSNAAATTINATATTGGNTNDQNAVGNASAADGGSSTPAVGQSDLSIDTGTNMSMLTADTVAKTSSVPPLTKTRGKLPARTTRPSQLRESDDTEDLKERETEDMHHRPSREPGDEFRGGAVDPEKVHLPIGERELSGYEAGDSIIGDLSDVRDGANQTADEDIDMNLAS